MLKAAAPATSFANPTYRSDLQQYLERPTNLTNQVILYSLKSVFISVPKVPRMVTDIFQKRANIARAATLNSTLSS